VKQHNPSGVPLPQGQYVHGCEVGDRPRLVFISGQIPEPMEGPIPSDFEGQCRVVWSHIGAVLAAAGMGYENLVKVTTFLTSRELADQNGAIRREVLGAHQPALTVIVCSTLNPAWLLEIEAVAAA
jgi:2-iminobutanoate/2-iminopropanoate deaminase